MIAPRRRPFPNRCPFGCPTCGRACSAAQRQSHRFDCCGQIAAHAPVTTNDSGWVAHRNPMQAGWLTGPSQTVAPTTERTHP